MNWHCIIQMSNQDRPAGNTNSGGHVFPSSTNTATLFSVPNRLFWTQDHGPQADIYPPTS